MEEKLWTKFNDETTKETTIFGKPGFVRITHFYTKDLLTNQAMLRGFLELDNDKLDYIMPFEITDSNK
jgi:hypothetical protein